MAGANRTEHAALISRRQALAGGAASVAGTAHAMSSTTTARSRTTDSHLELEQQIVRLMRRWNVALDRFAVAEQALWQAENDRADEAILHTLWAQQELAEEEAGALGTATRALTKRLVVLPAESLADFASKARIALGLGFDDLPRLILGEIVNLAGEIDRRPLRPSRGPASNGDVAQ